MAIDLNPLKFHQNAFRLLSEVLDEDIEVAPGRYLMEPVVLARMVQALDLKAADSVLVIGAATGYDSALIGRIAGPVVAVESSAELADQASMVINHLGIDNVAVVVGALLLLGIGATFLVGESLNKTEKTQLSSGAIGAAVGLLVGYGVGKVRP